MLLWPDYHNLYSYYLMGGFVMPPLLITSVLLWYFLTWRILHLRSSQRNPRELVRLARKGKLKSHSIAAKAALQAQQQIALHHSYETKKMALIESMAPIRTDLNRYRNVIRSLVAIAPLMGLLGTVDGMIETFNSLGDMALFTQTGGIAGGISKALFTTQMGLVISIPGLLIGRILEKRQTNISREIDQIQNLLLSDLDLETEQD